MSGAETLWHNEIIGGQGGYRQLGGPRLDAQAGYGVALGRRLVGTPHAGVQKSEYGRYYRAGYKIGLKAQDALQLELGAEVQQQENAWYQSGQRAGKANRRFVAHGRMGW